MNDKTDPKFKKFKKPLLIFATFLVLFFGFLPKQKKNQAQAFAITSTALAIGVVATLAVGGYVANQPVVQEIGNDVIDDLLEKGHEFSNFINYDIKTKFIEIVMNQAIKTSISNVIVPKANAVAQFKETGKRTIIDSTPVTSNGYLKSYTMTQDIIGTNDQRKYLNFPLTDFDFDMRSFEELHNSNDLYTDRPLVMNLTVENPYNHGVSVGFSANGLDKDLDFELGIPYSIFSVFVPANYSGEISFTGNDIGFHGPAGLVGANVDYDYSLMADSIWIDVEDFLIKDFSIDFLTPDIPLTTVLENVPTSIEDLDRTIDENLETDKTYTGVITNRTVTQANTIDNVFINSVPTTPEDDGTEDSGILGFLSAIYDFLISIPGLIAQAFTGLFDYLLEGITSALATIGFDLTPLQDYLSSMFGSLMGNLGSIISAIYGIPSSIVSAIQSIQSMISSPLSHITTIKDSFAYFLESGLLNILFGWSAVSADGLSLGSLFENAVSSLNTGLDNLWEDAGAVWTGFGETLTGIGDFLTGGLSTTMDQLINVSTNIRNAIMDLMDQLINGVGAITGAITGAVDWTTALTRGIVIPSELDRVTHAERYQKFIDDFALKFEFVTVPINTFKTVYNNPKSLYDVTFKIQDQTVHVLPRSLSPAVDVSRTIFTGVFVIGTGFNVYKRFRKAEAIP